MQALARAPAVVTRWRQTRRSQDVATLIFRAMAPVRAVPLFIVRQPRSLGRLDETEAAIERFAEGVSA